MENKRNLLDRALGLEEKRVWRELENRAKALGDDYYEDYQQMKKYIWLSGLTSWQDFKFVFEHLLDLLEDVAADGRKVTEVTGPDVASFLDEMADAKTWEDKYREKLNKKVTGE
jgi:DNA-binding ferritin-like protein (Dps family)